MLLNSRDDVAHFTGEPNVYNAGQNWSGNTADMLINGVMSLKSAQLVQTGIVSVREEQAVRKRGMANTSHVGPLDLN
jgi:hypothetical protein